MKLVKFAHDTLKFLNLTDRGGKLSITNIAVIVLITKMAISPFDWATAAGLLITLLNYSHKRLESSKAAKDERDTSIKKSTEEAINTLKEQIEQSEAKNKEVLDQITKQADEVRKIVNNNGLKEAVLPQNFYGRNK